MLIFPYSTALTLGRTPYISYAAVALCLVVYSMLFVALATGLGYSLWTVATAVEVIPTLGFSGVVMGKIGRAHV